MSTWRSVPLLSVAPPIPSKWRPAKDEAFWLLNLDQIESGGGSVISRRMAYAGEEGPSTVAFDTAHVLYSKLRPNLNKVVLPFERGVCTTELLPLKPDPDVLDRAFLAYYLKSPAFVTWAVSRTDGAKMPRVKMDVFREHLIPLPPLPEQRRLAAILDKADAIRRKRREALKFADEFLRAAFLHLFGDPVSNSKGLPRGTIRDLVSEVRYGSAAKADESEGRYPMLRMNNLTYQGELDLTSLKYVDLEPAEEAKYLTQRGDLLFNRTNSKELVGKTAVFDRDDPMAIAGYLIRVRTENKASTHYISGYLNSAHGKKTLMSMCKSIVGMANINAQELQDIPILLPPDALQERYAAIVARTRKTQATYRAHLNEANTLFDGLSHRAFQGTL